MAKQKPVIAWNNLFERGTVAASAEATGYEKENAYDGLSYDAWKASAAGAATLAVYCSSNQTVDCWGFYGSDLCDNSGTIKLQYSDDGTTWTDHGTTITPTHKGSHLQLVTSASHPFWRVYVSSTGSASYLKHVFIGARMTFERGVRAGVYVPQLARQPEIMGNLSEGGAFLGRSVRRQKAVLSVALQNLSESWVRSTWEPFQNYAQKKGFLFAWEPGDNGSEVAFCMARDPITTGYNDSMLMDSSFSMEALLEEPEEQASVALPVPSAPANFVAATGDAQGEIDLSWDAVTPTLGSITYTIYRSTTAGGARTTVATGQTLTTYTDTGLSNGTTYYYAVTATDTAGQESAESTEDSAATIAYYQIDSASYDSVSKSVSAQDSTAYSLAFNADGTKMYMLGLASATVYQYTLSSAFDVSTASYDSVSLDVSGQDAAPLDLIFKADGSKMYIVGGDGDKIYQYTLVTAPWDLSVATYESVSLDVTSQMTTPLSAAFKADGTKLYVTSYPENAVYQYSLGTAWDLSTATYDSVSFASGARCGITFKPDGTKMFLVDTTGATVDQYSLSTAWDLSTTSDDSISLDVSTQESDPRDAVFNADGSKLYVLGSSGNTVYQYSSTNP